MNRVGADFGPAPAPFADTTPLAGAMPESWENQAPQRRFWQVVVSAVALAVLAPVWLMLALAIKITSRGPVLYRGKRVGLGGKPFEIVKFRTLELDAEKKIGARLLDASDEFYTPIGRYLKRSKLDEIPQLINVIRGDMNLVGPRPVRPIFLATFAREIPGYWRRFSVRPGITGLAQLRGGYHTHPRNKLRYDLLYIRNRSVWLDVKLLLGTFVKVLNKWITFGVLLTLLFLSASLVPGLFHSPFQLEVGGFRISPFEMVLLILAVSVVVKSSPGHQFYIYRCPLNLPIACFLGYALLSAFFASEPVAALQGVAYLAVTGFAMALLIVHQGMNARLLRQVVNVVAVSAAAVAVVGVVEMLVGTHTNGAAMAGLAGISTAARESYPRIASTLGNPVVLSAFLVLGIPLLFTEVMTATSQAKRDFWLVASTIAMIAVFLTQTRAGMLALLVTVGVFLWKVSRRALVLFTMLFVAFMVTLSWFHALRLSPAGVSEVAERVERNVSAVFSEPLPRLLVGVGATQRLGSGVSVNSGVTGKGEVKVANMHLTLVRQFGLVGWGLVMWVFVAVLVTLYRAERKMAEERPRLTLWAIFSSLCGFLISMCDFNAFYNPSIQVFTWGLVGVGVAIVVHMNGRRNGFSILYRFGIHGD